MNHEHKKHETATVDAYDVANEQEKQKADDAGAKARGNTQGKWEWRRANQKSYRQPTRWI